MKKNGIFKERGLHMKCILLHGLGQNAAAWDDTVRYMDEKLDILCPELFDWLSGSEASYPRLYKELEKYCGQIKEPIALGGLSLGGILALQYTIEHSDKVDSLVLAGTQFSMPKSMLRMQNMIFRFLPDAAFANMGLGKKDVISLCKSMMELDFTEQLKDIHCRTLVLCGAKDKSNIKASEKLNEQIDHAELVLISNAGHEVNKDNPTQLGQVISSFVMPKG